MGLFVSVPRLRFHQVTPLPRSGRNTWLFNSIHVDHSTVWHFVSLDTRSRLPLWQVTTMARVWNVDTVIWFWLSLYFQCYLCFSVEQIIILFYGLLIFFISLKMLLLLSSNWRFTCWDSQIHWLVVIHILESGGVDIPGGRGLFALILVLKVISDHGEKGGSPADQIIEDCGRRFFQIMLIWISPVNWNVNMKRGRRAVLSRSDTNPSTLVVFLSLLLFLQSFELIVEEWILEEFWLRPGLNFT